MRLHDGNAFDQLVRSHGPRMLGIASRILRTQADAEDATQEALISAWKHIDQFDGKAAIGTWLHTITVNTSLALLKRVKRNQDVSQLSEIEELSVPVDNQTNDLKEQIWEEVDNLPDPYRLVLVLCDVEGRSGAEVASTLGLSEAAVRKRLSRARAKIATKLAPELATQLTMSCGGTPSLLWEFVHGLLSGTTLQLVGDHVSSCPRCGALATYGELLESGVIPIAWYSRETWTSLGLKFDSDNS